MNRETLFRGKRIDTSEWVFGGYSNNNGAALIHEKLKNWLTVPQTIGQSTGRTDIDGNTIFEGDILMFTSKTDEQRICVVKWDEEVTAVMGYFKTGVKKIGLGAILMSGYVTIIGNIHDDPEVWDSKW